MSYSSSYSISLLENAQRGREGVPVRNTYTLTSEAVDGIKEKIVAGRNDRYLLSHTRSSFGISRSRPKNDNPILVDLILQETVYVGVILALFSIAQQCVHAAYQCFHLRSRNLCPRSRCLSFPSKRKKTTWGTDATSSDSATSSRAEASTRTNFTWGCACDSFSNHALTWYTVHTSRPRSVPPAHHFERSSSTPSTVARIPPLSITTTESNHA
jgi:hypothetical protein